MDDIKNIIESLLFVSKEPLSIEIFKKIIPEADSKEIRAALFELSDEYEQRKGGFYLYEVAGGYQLRSRPKYRQWISRLIQPSPARLSSAALETLAIVAYRQPIIRSDIENIRGVDSGGIIRMLLEKKLIKVLGHKDIPGRPLIYSTTKKFLEVFGLKDLKDLPTPKEIEDLGIELYTKQEIEGQTPEAKEEEKPPAGCLEPSHPLTPEPYQDMARESETKPSPGIEPTPIPELDG